uniref:Synaptobrevin, longin-like domain protein n=1 Tax=Tanacetum cinerariifolium TaxID=118510 RepID=A0A6L2JJG6_TANCI|nr:hypothetical protein [Tanacetum cinerariifolium]
MISILEKYEQNVDFHPIVDFVEASHIRYALTFNPTLYVSYIRQFWSTVRIETMEEETKILATVDGNLRTITESSIKRNLKLNDEAGISSLPDAELFENLTLMGYNISPNQKFTFQKGQLSHQWKYLIHTIMQCMSPKSTGFNEFSSNIATTLVCLATNRTYNSLKIIFDGLVKNVNNKISKFLIYPRFLTMCLRMGQFGQITHTHKYVVPFHTRKLFTTLRVNSLSFSGRIVPLFDSMLIPPGKGSGTPTEPHHTPSSEAPQTSHTLYSSPTLPPVTIAPIPTVTPSDTPHLRPYTRRARIALFSALPPVVDEPASPLRDVSQGEACPTDSGFVADQDRANIAKTSTLPSDSTPRVTSLAADEGSMQQKLDKLTALCTSLQRQHSEMGKRLDEREAAAERLSSDTEEIRLDEREAAAERVSNDTEEMATILTSMDAASILTSRGVQVVPTTAVVSTATISIPTGSRVVPTPSPTFPTTAPIFATATTFARELEEEMEREAQRMNAQIARDAGIAKIHVEEELQKMIEGLDRTNEIIAKHLIEYNQAAAGLSIRERIELINELVKYQDRHSKILQYQAQQRKTQTKKQKRDFYMAVIKSNLVRKQIKDFIPMGSKEEAVRFKRKGIRFKQEGVKKIKTSEEVPKEVKSTEEVLEEKVKEMIQLVLVEEVLGGSSASCQFFMDMLKHLDRKDLNQLWRLVKETLSIKPATNEKEMELWVELKRLYEPDADDQLWTHT